MKQYPNYFSWLLQLNPTNPNHAFLFLISIINMLQKHEVLFLSKKYTIRNCGLRIGEKSMQTSITHHFAVAKTFADKKNLGVCGFKLCNTLPCLLEKTFWQKTSSSLRPSKTCLSCLEGKNACEKARSVATRDF